MIIHNDEQGSPAWLEARRGVITASRFKDCRDKLKSGKPSGKCLGYAMDVARERAGGLAPPKFQTAAMRTGHDQEAAARTAYEIKTGNLVEEAGFITTDDRFFGVSVDGFVGEDGVVEIKTMVSSDTLFTAVVNGDIDDYVDQCNGAMWLLTRKWVDLVLWAPDLEHIGRHLTVIRITRDENKIQELEDELMEFLGTVEQLESNLKKKAA
ncbi:lambda exonuclease family protein [Comamonadaceae bacterium PP-2]